MPRTEVGTIQIGKAYIPIANAVAKAKKMSARKYIEGTILKDAEHAGIIIKKSEENKES